MGLKQQILSCQSHCSFRCGHKNANQVIATKDCYNNIWIVFSNSKYFEKFYNIVADKNNEKMYELMMCDRYFSNGKKNKYTLKDEWSAIFCPNNNGVNKRWTRSTVNGKRQTFETLQDFGCDKNDFELEVQLTFPKKHLQYVESRLDLELAYAAQNKICASKQKKNLY